MHIHELRLATTALAAQHAFYAGVFGFPAVETATSVTFQIGPSRLTFQHASQPLAGVYHFAFDIPENQFEAARQWLAGRVPLLPDETGEAVFYSQNWNAHMVYFADPAGNIGELIARHTLPNASDEPFSVQSILNISEIGIAAEDVPAQVAELQAQTGAGVYQGPGHPMFTPVGDEHGLLIVVQRGRIWHPNTGKPAEHVPIAVVVNNQNDLRTLEFG